MTTILKHIRTIVVGVNGSAASNLAVDAAALIAAENDARLVLVTGYLAGRQPAALDDILKRDAYLIHGGAPAEELVRQASEREAVRAVRNVTRCAIATSPDKALLAAACEAEADLIVLGDSGIRRHRCWGLPTLLDAVARKSTIDLLVVSQLSGGRRVIRWGASTLRRPLTGVWDGFRSAAPVRSRL
ncbi:universal stress protein [Nocardia panacis]|uniref:Universal stress protein n=1 Tax=Nocardia panacis TaxID=2340916 RepID=A0A3A4JZK6_9NOCA|nr:universal stress protein [Nocardia panacis]RJO70106.1 universal stress protein [Nocardia panacis]